ncbi:hypothetical protein BFP72_15340 [Reichenbachiella sp. 5M10]|uniref:DUF4270 family protein n=1 Tax=Reichenbachiella sp. 5M10 TaxID=1889772 RepID=UPI000C1531F6|nr:DUF4270 family protein [Reichenbachiella sp. 5M10]PIB36679.1 hypothetical protein BFP72_15340 [Reichenbachiella sp. 5M10]
MNLLDKNWLGLLIFTTLIIFSCEDPSEVGLGLDPDGLGSGVYYEEIILPAENVWIDSLRTNNSSRLFVGRIEDPIFGTTTAATYNQLSSTSLVSSKTDEQEYVIDSAVLTLGYDYIHTKGAIAPQTIRLQELDDQIFSGVYYLSHFDTPLKPYDADNVFTFTPRSDSVDQGIADTVKFYLNDIWAETLFDIATQSNRTELLTQTFKGIALTPDDNNNLIVGFTPAGYTNISVHYHILGKDINQADSIVSDSLSVAYSLSASNAKYSKFTTDRTGSLIGGSIKNNLENFEVGNGFIYLNSATGIYPKIDMTPFLDFLNDDENDLIQINNLEFQFSTSNDTSIYNRKMFNTRLFFAGDSSQINVDGLYDLDILKTVVLNDIGYLTGSQDMLVMPIDSATQSYRGGATFFGQQVENGNVNPYKLVVMPSLLTSFNQTILPQDGFKLRIFYSKPN